MYLEWSYVSETIKSIVDREEERNFHRMSTSSQIKSQQYHGGLAQMVERSLSMREVPGSMPGSSSHYTLRITR